MNMKKTISILILLILIPTLCFAGSLQEKQRQVIAKKNVAAPSGDSCTGALKLSAHFENSDTITSGTPAGCNSNADTTWALEAGLAYSSTQKSDGTYSLYASTGTNNKTASITIDDNKTEGTVIFDIWAITLDNFNNIMWIDLASPDANNKILVEEISGSYYVYYYGGGSSISASATHTTGSFQTVTVKWRTTGSPHLSIQVDSGTAGTNTNDLPTLSGSLATFNIGQGVTTNNEFYIDKVKVYNSWQ
jgi:hypothetical protein